MVAWQLHKAERALSRVVSERHGKVSLAFWSEFDSDSDQRRNGLLRALTPVGRKIRSPPSDALDCWNHLISSHKRLIDSCL